MTTREIIPLKQRPGWKVTLPGSKSITNRAFLCAALAKGKSRIYGALRSDDTDVMLRALRKLKVKSSKLKDGGIVIEGCGGEFKRGKMILDLHNAGTATRFLTAVMAIRKGETIITGNQRMQERPIKDLVDGLRQIGAEIEYFGKEGCPPLKVKSYQLKVKSLKEYTIKIKGDKSSQYFSALLMLGPMLDKPLKIEVIGDMVSKPYIDITLAVMKAFGVKVKNNNYHSFIIKPQIYRAADYRVEGDASAASYWTSIAALHGGKVTFTNLNLPTGQAGKKSVQGDAQFEHALKQLQIKNSELRMIDMNAMPDVAMTLAVCAPFFKGRTKITGLSTLRIKETDRLAALEAELKKVGVKAKTDRDSIIIYPMTANPSEIHPKSIRTYNDHRVAMCFAVLGTMVPGVKIENPSCTEKTYPDFWSDLELAYLSPIKLGQKNLVLTGMRCSGKTYLGKKIAKFLGRRFIDLDHEIEKQEKIKIRDIVKCYGWGHFRNIEQKMCSAFGGQKSLVIATGGGVVLDEKNMKALKKNGVNVFVFADPSVLLQRIKRESENRPSLTGKGAVAEVNKVWRERRDLYLKYADVVWDDTSGNAVKEAIARIFV